MPKAKLKLLSEKETFSIMFRSFFNAFVTFVASFLMCGVSVFGNIENEFKHVTCGSAVKLLNPYHNVRLHSHEVKYGSGSGQQLQVGYEPSRNLIGSSTTRLPHILAVEKKQDDSVTGVGAQDDVNSLWVIKGKTGLPCKRGNPVKCGSTIRLFHQTTKRFLHSHLFTSPLSNNQEVSAFGEGGVGDEGDHWSVICSTKFWNRDDKVRFKHTLTKKYLHLTGQTFGRPINGQSEVSAYSYTEPGNEWKTMEGVYIQTDETK